MNNLRSYKGDQPYIFISYSHKDKDGVFSVLSQMQTDGYRVWFDEGIDPGTEWDDEIAKNICDCGYFIAFITRNYLLSENCKDELSYARDLDKKRLLVYLEEVTLPAGMAMRMNRIQYVNKPSYVNDADFYEKLYSSDGISEFSSNGGKSTVSKREESSFTVNQPKRTYGRINFEDGSVYEGEKSLSGQMDGHGTLRSSNGNVYEGDFKEGKRHGKGVLTYADGDVYKGEFYLGKRHGKGIMHCADGDVYEGNYKNNIMDGQFIIRFANGDVYEGGIIDNGTKSGYSIYRFKDGGVYKGDYRNGEWNGYGEYTYPDGCFFKGEVKDGKFNGRGTYHFENGDVYEGNFENGLFNGEGVYRYASGTERKGVWKDGKRISG